MPDLINNRKKYNRGWVGGLPETKCGYGSRLANTRAQRRWIPGIVKKYGIRSIVDVGAGDLNWLLHIQAANGTVAGATYTALDLVPRHPQVKPFDLLADPVPAAEMVMCLWVLNHFPKADAEHGFLELLASGAQWLLITYRPTWREDSPLCLADYPYVERIVLNKKQDQIRLCKIE